MRKSINVILLVLVMFVILLSGCISGIIGSSAVVEDEVGDIDFMRGSQWGDSKVQVKERETERPREDSRTLFYFYTNTGLPSSTGFSYNFTKDDRLESIIYIFTAKGDDLDFCFNKVYTILSETYGDSEDFSSSDNAVGFSKRHEWNTDDTCISLYLNAQNAGTDILWDILRSGNDLFFVLSSKDIIAEQTNI